MEWPVYVIICVQFWKPAWSESFLKPKKVILIFVVYWTYLQVPVGLSIIYDVVGSLYSLPNKPTKTVRVSELSSNQSKSEHLGTEKQTANFANM